MDKTILHLFGLFFGCMLLRDDARPCYMRLGSAKVDSFLPGFDLFTKNPTLNTRPQARSIVNL